MMLGARSATVSNVGANATCVATFGTAQYQVVGGAVDETGTGITGVVSAVSAGVTCPTAMCTVPSGGSGGFAAAATSGTRVFKSFSGSCTEGAGRTATIATVLAGGMCTANYGPPPTVTITTTQVTSTNADGGIATGTGTGTVSCGVGNSSANNTLTTCSVPPGTEVNITATAANDEGSYFAGWTGAGCPTAPATVRFPPTVSLITATQNITCTATWGYERAPQ
jgi:hypothetical protein